MRASNIIVRGVAANIGMNADYPAASVRPPVLTSDTTPQWDCDRCDRAGTNDWRPNPRGLERYG
jgi:hypothetical protein